MDNFDTVEHFIHKRPNDSDEERYDSDDEWQPF
jgi:hypothetical protein